MATALTQADLDRLDLAIARGVLRVTYASGTVEYRSMGDMLLARQFIVGQLASVTSTARPSMTTLAVYDRE